MLQSSSALTRFPHPGIVLLGCLASGAARGVEPQDFADYVWGRAGDGELIYRVSTGQAYDIDSGEMVARLEGLETAIAVNAVGDDGTVYHVGRAFLLYRDPDNDAVLDAYPGKDPDAQTLVSAYSIEDGEFAWHLASPAGEAPPRRAPGSIDCERQGTVLYCLRNSAYDSPAGMSVLEYRWTVDRAATSIEAAARSEFAETEPPHPGISEGPIMIRLTSYRVLSWDALPATLRDWVEAEAPGFRELPNASALIEAAGFER